jgi:hypothetical protein
MILKLLTNINYLLYIFCVLIFLLILTYLIYKLFILENDIFLINEKINKIELEFSNPDTLKSNSYNNNNKNSPFNLTEIIMNEVFNNDKQENNICNMKSCNNKCPINEIKEDNSNVIDIDKILNNEIINDVEEEKINKEQIFDLKKEILTNDNDSVISGETQITKKKLLKLNLDKLKEKCNELNISNEGTKAQLIDKILDEINKDV